MDPIGLVKKAKHQLYLGSMRAKRAARNTGYALYDRILPYRFAPERYPLSFVRLNEPACPVPMAAKVPSRIFVVWAGDNELTPGRRAGLASIRSTNPDLDIVLVTPDNLDDYLVAGHPLHPAYHQLSFVHRSDYLHSYLLHHHGGGYTGLKPHPNPWAAAFSELERDPDAWILGYRIPTVREATAIDGPIGRDVHRHYTSLIGTGGMIARAYSQLTFEWTREAHRRLDYYCELLARTPGDAFGGNTGYPLPWTTLGSQILEPLCLKYLPHVRQNPAVKPQLWGHR